jgi:hypothetical protein
VNFKPQRLLSMSMHGALSSFARPFFHLAFTRLSIRFAITLSRMQWYDKQIGFQK